MNPALLGTDTLSLLMRRDISVTRQATAYLQEHGQFTFSIITRYEVLRGLEARDARVQIARFHALCEASHVLPLSDSVVVRAAAVYGDLYRARALIGDADILIAATALVEGLVLVTNNARHLGRIQAMRIENWHDR